VDIINSMIARTLAILLGAWMGMSTAFFAAFLVHGWRRKKAKWTGPLIADCPFCKGDGVVADAFDEMAVCPLCDGDRTLTAPNELNP
jgi:hypothetical protein